MSGVGFRPTSRRISRRRGSKRREVLQYGVIPTDVDVAAVKAHFAANPTKNCINKGEVIGAPGSSPVTRSIYKLDNGVILVEVKLLSDAGASAQIFTAIDIDSKELYVLKKLRESYYDASALESECELFKVQYAKRPEFVARTSVISVGATKVLVMPKAPGTALVDIVTDKVNAVELDDYSEDPRPPAPAPKPRSGSFVEDEGAEGPDPFANIDLDALAKAGDEEPDTDAGEAEAKRKETTHFKTIPEHREIWKETFAENAAEVKQIARLMLDELQLTPRFVWKPDVVMHRTPSLVLKGTDKDQFLERFDLLLKLAIDTCEDNVSMHGYVEGDLKTDNTIYDETTGVLSPIDKGGAVPLKGSTVAFVSRELPEGTIGCMSYYNEKAMKHHIAHLEKINNARQLLALQSLLLEKALVQATFGIDVDAATLTTLKNLYRAQNLTAMAALAKEKGIVELQDPAAIREFIAKYYVDFGVPEFNDPEFIQKLEQAAIQVPYIFNAKAAANSIGVELEEVSAVFFEFAARSQKWMYKANAKDGKFQLLPDAYKSAINDPFIELFNQYIKIAKKLRDPNVADTYTAAEALHDLRDLSKRAAMLHKPQSAQAPGFASYKARSGKLRDIVKFGGVRAFSSSVRSTVDAAWSNAVTSLQLSLNATKYKVRTTARGVEVREIGSYKPVAATQVKLATVETEFAAASADGQLDREAAKDIIKMHLAAAEPGDVMVIECADRPKDAITLESIAIELGVKIEFDADTKAAVAAEKSGTTRDKPEAPPEPTVRRSGLFKGRPNPARVGIE